MCVLDHLFCCKMDPLPIKQVLLQVLLGTTWCCSICLYFSFVSSPFILTSFPTPKAEIQPQTVTLPSTCFTVFCKHCMLQSSPGLQRPNWHLLDIKSSNFDSSDQNTQFDCLVAQCWCCLGNISFFHLILRSQQCLFFCCNSATWTCCTQSSAHSAR